jgi:hypothetical protein
LPSFGDPPPIQRAPDQAAPQAVEGAPDRLEKEGAPEDVAAPAGGAPDAQNIEGHPDQDAGAPNGFGPGFVQGSYFTTGRRASTRYMKSRGEDRRARGRAAREFVRSASRGRRAAAQRMSSERAAAGRIAGLLGGAAAAPGGIREYVRTLNLPELADRPIREIYAALVDVIFPPNDDPMNGTLDDSYAKDAYLEAVNGLDAQGVDLERPTEPVARAFMASFIANAVRLRIIRALIDGIVSMPSDPELARQINAGLFDFLRGCAVDALAESVNVLQVDAFRAQIDDLFERTVEFIEFRGDAMAEGAE